MGQQLKSTNENLENVKQEVATLKEKIEPSAPPITAVAVTESNPTEASPYSIATLSSNTNFCNMYMYYYINRTIELH